WKTDGTDAGTVLVKDIRQGPGSSSPWDWLVVDDILYFRADDGIHGSELWRSDGTSSGTTLVADVRKGPASAYPRPLRDMNGALLFGANTISGSLELWQSRGTGATTSLLTRNWGGCRDKLPGGSRRGYFAGPVASGERPEWGLWETDGTPSGTRALFQQRPWRRGFSPSSLTLTRGKLLFSASDPVAGRELWVLDPGATAQRAGVACGAVAKRPTLDASDPVLGRTMQISGRQAPASALSLLLVGARAAPPVRFSGTCHAYVDPASLATLHAFVATQAAWKLPLRLPPGKSLVGAHLALQSWFLHPTQGIALSNAVYLTLGF
ncbi:MAG: ELWxxDGT repeat protein, partial [Planctomycetota bacterium]